VFIDCDTSKVLGLRRGILIIIGILFSIAYYVWAVTEIGVISKADD